MEVLVDPFTSTKLQLIAMYRGPAVQLEEICERYLSLSWHTARNRAALNLLPFPTFKLTDSRKAPLMVTVDDLARHIDASRDAARKEWELSQV